MLFTIPHERHFQYIYTLLNILLIKSKYEVTDVII